LHPATEQIKNGSLKTPDFAALDRRNVLTDVSTPTIDKHQRDRRNGRRIYLTAPGWQATLRLETGWCGNQRRSRNKQDFLNTVSFRIVCDAPTSTGVLPPSERALLIQRTRQVFVRPPTLQARLPEQAAPNAREFVPARRRYGWFVECAGWSVASRSR